MQRIRGKMTELELAMEREQQEKEHLSKILADNSRASALREQKLTSVLKAVAAKLPGGKGELHDLLRSIGKS
jgi:Tfp pilus assembly protein PilO